MHARDWPMLLSAHPNLDRGPPKKFLSWKLNIGPKIQRMRLNNFGAGGNIFTKLLQTTCHEAGVIICVQFWKACPLKFGRAKKRPNFGAISDNFRLWSRISSERIYISNIWKKIDQPQPIPRWQKKIGELWSTNKKGLEVHTDPPTWTFCRRLHFRP